MKGGRCIILPACLPSQSTKSAAFVVYQTGSAHLLLPVQCQIMDSPNPSPIVQETKREYGKRRKERDNDTKEEEEDTIKHKDLPNAPWCTCLTFDYDA